MRFKFSIDADWQVTVTSPELGDAWKKTRKLRRVPQGGTKGTFPLPPDNELPAAGEPHASLCAGDLKALEKAQQNIVQRRNDTSEAYGRYLFDTLIGETLWTAMMKDVAGQPLPAGVKVPIVELALCWNADQGDLHRLPWELMRRADGFVAGSRAPRVAVTRMVTARAVAPGDPLKDPLAPLELPPRVLFVIGTSATDSAIRPGAEIVGLLRDLSTDSNRRIFSRVLERATPKRLHEMMASFRPQVVHFICHGDLDDGEGFLELRSDDDPNQGLQRFAVGILTDLEVNGALPQAVVLSACQTGTMLQGQQSAPLAARLVAGGIPVVVGMAGRVSDLACRLFTRKFGETLLKGEQLVRAATDARRAALANGTPGTIDWAYPAVFLAEHVPHGFSPVVPAADDERIPSEVLISAYRLGRDPVFCGRQEFFDAYEQLFLSKGARAVLAAHGESRSGKSRLLFELTAQALRDGHVPILIAGDDPMWEPPRTPDLLVKALIDAIVRAHEAFDVEMPASLRLQALRHFDRSNPALPASLAVHLSDKTKATAFAIRALLREDLARLVKEAREKHPAVARNNGLPIVLLDKIDQYDKDVLNDLFNGDQVLGDEGLGATKVEAGAADRYPRIPVILTFAVSGPAQEILRAVVESKGSRKWLNALPIGLFRQDGEDLLAYERVLLHPYGSKLLQGYSDRAIAAAEADTDKVRDCQEMFRDTLGGRPHTLGDQMLYGLAKKAIKDGVFQYANDEDLLKEQLKND